MVKLDKHADSIIKFISELNCTESLSNDATYMLMNDLVERIKLWSDISKKTKDSYKQAEFNNIVDNTLTLIEFLDKANNNNVDLFVGIHFNALNGSAYGTEVFTYGWKELPEAIRVLNNLANWGYASRCKLGNNIHIRDGFSIYILRNTKMKSMLMKCCFCDNKADMAKFDAEKMSGAIVKGLVDKLAEKPQTNTKDNLYRVQVGAFRNK